VRKAVSSRRPPVSPDNCVHRSEGFFSGATRAGGASLAAVIDRPTQAAAYTVSVDGRKVIDSTHSANTGGIATVRRWAPVLLAALLSIGAIILVSNALPDYDGPLWLALPLQLVGFPYILGGAALWVHRPGNYLGPVSMLLGATWYLGDLQSFDQEALFVAGFAGYHLNVVVFAHLALMVPAGRLVDRLDKLVVAALYVMVPTTQLLRYLEVRPYIDRTTFGDVTAYYSTWAHVATYLGLPLALAAAARVVRRFRKAKAKQVQRRPFGLFWIAAAGVGACAAAAAALESFSSVAQQIALLAYCVMLMAAALGLVIGAINVAASDFDAWSRLATDVHDLERTVRTAAGDPDLRFYVRDQDAWRRGPDLIDDEAADAAGAARIDLTVGGEPVALMVHDRELAYQRPLVQAIVTMTLAALARLRLTQDRNAAAVDAQQAERERIVRDLHDEVGLLRTWVRRIVAVADRLPADHPEKERLVRMADGAGFLEGRLKQILHNVYPQSITKGLRIAVRTLLEEGIDPAQDGFAVAVDIPAGRPGSGGSLRVEVEVYFFIAEAVQNAIKHSAGTEVSIVVRQTDRAVHVSVDDDGRGWPAEDGRRGNGLANMAARVELLNGTMTRDASPQGGARVAAVLPVPGSADGSRT
jgi:signal transduction histidine kinase